MLGTTPEGGCCCQLYKKIKSTHGRILKSFHGKFAGNKSVIFVENLRREYIYFQCNGGQRPPSGVVPNIEIFL